MQVLNVSSSSLLQRNDIAMAITKFDQFDFLIDIVPRDELKPPKRQVRPEIILPWFGGRGMIEQKRGSFLSRRLSAKRISHLPLVAFCCVSQIRPPR